MRDVGVISPSPEEFHALAQHHRVIPVTMTVLADAVTPVGLYQRLAEERAGTFLLESAAQGGVWSRYSFIGAASSATLTERNGQAHWQGQPPAGLPTQGTALDVLATTLDQLTSDVRADLGTEVPYLLSGMVGYLGWETVRHWEHLPNPPVDDLQLPELAMNLMSEVAIHDHVDGTVTLVANAIDPTGLHHRTDEAYQHAVSRVRNMAQLISASAAEPVSVAPAGWQGVDTFERVKHSWDESEFLATVAEAQEAIADGEVFQIVVSRRFTTETQVSGLQVYRALRAMNPSPYMFLYTFDRPDGSGQFQLVGASPEALVTVNDGQVVTHPIAGSRPRGTSLDEDHRLAEELLADEKERSEHLMLVDLSRNDLSKVCRPGSVQVGQFMEIERFSHVMHLVSHVSGTLEPSVSALDVLAAAFPAGTLSGSPKPRTLQLLDAWEPQARGPYGGVVGYIDFAGNMDMAIAIRTVLLKDGVAYVQAGAGIVADSVPAAEAAETVAKASAPLRALFAAEQLRHYRDDDRDEEQ
ncbi:anthranilate synthase component I [Auritidibacter ignavus]|uniref:Anthranilate synthase component 1 n=1 Tax=Auritidibacter ignavus TaxID=678932 RepID=A0AAJ6AMN7_9MICC|nr:anthranilate synthase component I [Auritidibacter ignavus]WGH93623.1 anthranilate synthase component I [Auritidibacter ignavus]